MEQFVRFENPSGTSSEIHPDTDLLRLILHEKGIEPLILYLNKTPTVLLFRIYSAKLL